MKEQIKDGGPAFPCDTKGSFYPEFGAYGHQTGLETWQFGGMTLRDYFAAKAMQGFAADPQVDAGAEKVAQIAYAWADAMLAAREAKS